MKTEHIIGKVKAAGYRNFIAWAESEDHHRSDVHIASFAHPKLGNVECFVKIYPALGGSSRGIINEITAYLCAHALGIPQPDYAFVANIPLKKLGRLSGWLATAHKKTDTLPAFCTHRLDGKSAAVRVPDTQMQSVIEDIKGWPSLPQAVALDENIANTDRHINNLIRLGRKRFALIDGGRLANHADDPNWSPKTLSAHDLYRNRLSEHVWEHQPDDDSISRMLDLVTNHPDAFAGLSDELNYWWSILLPKEDHLLFQQFLQHRTCEIERLIKKRYHRLI